MRTYPQRRPTEETPVRVRPPDNGQEIAQAFNQLSAPEFPRWLSVEQVRKMQRMRRETVLEAISSGELPCEKRGRICYIRLSDVLAWEEKRLNAKQEPAKGLIHGDLTHLL